MDQRYALQFVPYKTSNITRRSCMGNTGKHATMGESVLLEVSDTRTEKNSVTSLKLMLIVKDCSQKCGTVWLLPEITVLQMRSFSTGLKIWITMLKWMSCTVVLSRVSGIRYMAQVVGSQTRSFGLSHLNYWTSIRGASELKPCLYEEVGATILEKQEKHPKAFMDIYFPWIYKVSLEILNDIKKSLHVTSLQK